MWYSEKINLEILRLEQEIESLEAVLTQDEQDNSEELEALRDDLIDANNALDLSQNRILGK